MILYVQDLHIAPNSQRPLTMLVRNVWQNALTGVLPITTIVNNSIQTCSPTAISSPDVPGIHVLALTAVEVLNYSASTMQLWDSPPRNLIGLNFCNVTVTYTHPGQHDVINVQTWLPLKAWNGRFQGVSGGGWITGLTGTLPLRIHQGYAASATDGGHPEASTPDDWALFRNGSVNTYLLRDFAHVALHELALIGKAIVKSYYGRPPAYSYWNGCSTGGRQGLQLAQRYPKDFDGIIANCPANNWANFIVAEYWPQIVMNQLGVYPELCEFDAITAAATEACDMLDGVKDGVIAAPGLCKFNPRSLVGQEYDCHGVRKTITKEATIVAEQTWNGPFAANGTRRWYGLSPDASFWLLPGTKCEADFKGITVCTGRPFRIAEEWIRLFVINNASYNVATLEYEQYDALFPVSVAKFDDIISAVNPDLSGFRAAGGKMITWHGLTDAAIFPNGSSDYYQRVLEKDPNARDFYRYFEAPGVSHCAPGVGPYPQDVLETLIEWVEKGVAPETLRGELIDAETHEVRARRELCQWPLVSRYIGGDVTQASSYVCDTGFS
jgi:hypothetical protein